MSSFKKIGFFSGLFCLFTLEAVNLVYVPNVNSNSISVIDSETNTVISTIPLSQSVGSIVFTPDGKFAYLHAANVTLVLNVATSTVVDTIHVGLGSAFEGIAITPNGSFVYVPNVFANTVSVINTIANQVVATINVGLSPGIAITTPNGDTIYTINNTTINAIQTSTNTVVATIAPVGPLALVAGAITPDGSQLYVTDGIFPQYYIISTSTNQVIAIENSIMAVAVAFNSSGTLAYISDVDNIYAVNTTTQAITATIHIGAEVLVLSRSIDGQFLYGSSGSSNVVVIDTVTNTLIATVPVGLDPWRSAGLNTVSPFGPFGSQIANRFLTQTDYMNELSWNAPANFIPVSYLIYRDTSQTELAGTVPGFTLKFEDHNRKPKTLYTYTIIAVAPNSSTLNIGSISVPPIN